MSKGLQTLEALRLELQSDLAAAVEKATALEGWATRTGSGDDLYIPTARCSATPFSSSPVPKT